MFVLGGAVNVKVKFKLLYLEKDRLVGGSGKVEPLTRNLYKLVVPNGVAK